MSDYDTDEPHDHHGLEHGYTPPDQRRRKALHRKDDLGPKFDETLYVQIGLGVVVLFLLLWFLYHIIQEKKNDNIRRGELRMDPAEWQIGQPVGVYRSEFTA
jgi:hypothetical protein